jgi:hypothetical protein
MAEYSKSVFVNCPFDDDYRQLLVSILFTVKYLGFTPRLTLETADSSNTCLATIVDFIATSKFGIHDLSRISVTSERKPARMNMPFELSWVWIIVASNIWAVKPTTTKS